MSRHLTRVQVSLEKEIHRPLRWRGRVLDSTVHVVVLATAGCRIAKHPYPKVRPSRNHQHEYHHHLSPPPNSHITLSLPFPVPKHSRRPSPTSPTNMAPLPSMLCLLPKAANAPPHRCSEKFVTPRKFALHKKLLASLTTIARFRT